MFLANCIKLFINNDNENERNLLKMIRENEEHPAWEDADLLVKAMVPRPEIQLLCKYVEGLGHLGVVTTTDRMSGEVIIQTTKHCWPELYKNLTELPINIKFL